MVFAFPNPVNEKAARVVAAGVCALSIVTLATGAYWLAAVLAYGFAARVLTGPTLSPLGQLATRVIAPALGPAKLVPGPPKRFAQAIGLLVTTLVALAALVAGEHLLADVGLGLMIAASALESLLGYCVGCRLFALYVALYSGFRIWEETLRIDPSKYLFGLRLNLYVAALLTLIGLVWFAWTQRRRGPAATPPPAAG